MEMIVLDTLGKLHRYGHGLFGWCTACGSPSRYWEDVRRGARPSRRCSMLILWHSFASAAGNLRWSSSRRFRARGAARQRQRRASRRQRSQYAGTDVVRGDGTLAAVPQAR
jgi:hypothetical protein